jgi:hypothetical protein
MLSDREIRKEVRAVIEEALAAERPAKLGWIVHEVLLHHQDLRGADAGFYLRLAHDRLPATVRDILRDFGVQAKGVSVPEQLIMPGFHRLQRGYTVDRDGEQVLVPTPQLTDAEIDEKAAEHDAMADGNREHARELRQYKAARASAAA